MPLALLPLAALFFHRFDPVRTKAASDKGRRNWIGRLQMLLKPLSRRVVGLMMRPARGHSLGAAIWADAMLTLTLFPLALIALVVCVVATLAAAQPADVLPMVFLALGDCRLRYRDARSPRRNNADHLRRAAAAREPRLVETWLNDRARADLLRGAAADDDAARR